MFSNSYDPGGKDSALLPSQQRTLTEADHLMEQGKAAQAAPLYSKLAEILNSSGQPKHAANLHAKAALASAKCRNESVALAQARTALSLFLHYQMQPHAPIFYENIQRELNRHMMKSVAATLEKEFGAKLKPASQPEDKPRHLPGNCPQCGAPLRSSDVHWVDDLTAECGFCGTPIQAS